MSCKLSPGKAHGSRSATSQGWLHVQRLHPVQVFEDLDFTLIEMNPFTLDQQGAPFPLDMRGELDDTAAFKSSKKRAPPGALSLTPALPRGP